MTRLGLGDLARFPFVEPPDRRNVTAGRAAARGAQLDHRPTRNADPDRQAAGPAADRPAAGPDDPRGRAARLRARGARDRRRAVAAGPARAPGRAAAAGRPAARPVQGRPLRLPDLAQPLALPQGTAERAQQQRVPPDVQARVPQLPAGPRVAGLRVPAAPGLQGDEDPDRSRRATSRDADGIHQALLSGLLSHIGLLEERDRDEARAARSTSAPAAPGSRSSPAAACSGRTRSS